MIIDKQCKKCLNYTTNLKQHRCTDPVDEIIPPRLHNKHWKQKRNREKSEKHLWDPRFFDVNFAHPQWPRKLRKTHE